MFTFDYLQNQRTHVKFRLGKGPSVYGFKPDQRGFLFKTMTALLSLCPDIATSLLGRKKEMVSKPSGLFLRLPFQ
jgi:hypothetical protein